VFPDSKRVLLTANEPGHGNRVYVQDIEGGAPRAISRRKRGCLQPLDLAGRKDVPGSQWNRREETVLRGWFATASDPPYSRAGVYGRLVAGRAAHLCLPGERESALHQAM
jgi:hypothetical protein